MFERADEHHGLMRAQMSLERAPSIRARKRFEFTRDPRPRSRRAIHAEYLLQLVDRAGCAGADCDDAAVGPCIDGVFDRAFRFVQQLRHVAAGGVVFGVRVRVRALQALQIVFDEEQTPPRSGVVAIHHEAFAERCRKRGIDADDLLAKELETRG